MLDRNSAALLVIDFQDRLLPKIHEGEAVAAHAIKLIRFAREMDMPLLWTEQYPKGLGPTVESVARELQGCTAFEKMSFGCLGDASIAAALEDTKRRQLLLTGIETHVCVMQTALFAMDTGYEVFIPRDAVGSRSPEEYAAGLHRLDKAGAQLVTTEMALFELLREAGTPEFKKALPLIK